MATLNLKLLTISVLISLAACAPAPMLSNILNDHNDIRRNVAEGDQHGCDKQSTIQSSGGYCLRTTTNPSDPGNYKFQSAADIIELKWDDALASVAQDHADICNWGHSDPTTRQSRMAAKSCDNVCPYSSGSYIGENIAMSSASTSQGIIDGLVQNWLGDEAINFEFTSSTSTTFSNSDFYCEYDTTGFGTDQCKHFTAGIWAKTQYIGCGYKQCSTTSISGTYLVCNYYPAGNVQNQNVYTIGSTCSNCPSAHTCQNSLCRANPTSEPTTAAPTGQTAAPTPPTPEPTRSPVAGCTPECIKLTGWTSNTFLNGEWQCRGVINGKPYYERDTDNYGVKTLSWHETYPIYFISGWNDYCTSATITDCGVGNWALSSTGYVSTFTCSVPATNNDEIEISIPLRSEDTSNGVTSYPFNMTEMHVILGLIIIVLLTIFALVIGFCYYVQKNNVQHQDEYQQHEMVYFENRNTEQNTPTADTKSANNEIEQHVQQSLNVSVNGAATMVTKLQTTTPVSPLIDVDQNYE